MAYISIKKFKEHPENFTEREVDDLCRNQKLTKKFMKKYAPYLNWHLICLYQPALYDEDYIDEVAEWVSFDALCSWSRHAHFSEQFIEKYKDRIHWGTFSRYCSSFT